MNLRLECRSYFVLAFAFLFFAPTQFILFNCLALFFIFNYLATRCTPPPPKKKQLSKQTPSSLTQICETKMQASGQQISMLNFCKLVMECYVGQSVTCCRQKLTRTCTCCIFVICILFGCMLFQQCPICLGWRSEIESQQKHAFAKACVFLSILL